jgi:hypothetical protein
MQVHAPIGDTLHAKLQGWPRDAARPLELRLFLALPDEDSSRAAVSRLAREGIDARTEAATDQDGLTIEASCIVRSSFLPSEETSAELNRLGGNLEALAASLGGRFAGWAVVWPQPSEETLAETESGVTCPQCGRKMKLRKSGRGCFLACGGYPACRAVREAPRELLQRIGASPPGLDVIEQPGW